MTYIYYKDENKWHRAKVVYLNENSAWTEQTNLSSLLTNDIVYIRRNSLGYLINEDDYVITIGGDSILV